MEIKRSSFPDVEPNAFIESMIRSCQRSLNNEGVFILICTPSSQATSFHTYTEDNLGDSEPIAADMLLFVAAFFAENGFINNQYGKPISGESF